jgi:hypothetical protein
LLGAGADPDQRDRRGNTALHAACKQSLSSRPHGDGGHRACIWRLLVAGASPGARNMARRTARQEAAARSDPAAAEALADFGRLAALLAARQRLSWAATVHRRLSQGSVVADTRLPIAWPTGCSDLHQLVLQHIPLFAAGSVVGRALPMPTTACGYSAQSVVDAPESAGHVDRPPKEALSNKRPRLAVVAHNV